MFGVMDLETGKCSGYAINEMDVPLEDYYRGYKVIAFHHAIVPKDYINIWKSGRKCEHEGCFEGGTVECHIPDGGEYFKRDKNSVILLEHLCCDHAFKAGYCIVCGEFWGGIEDFDFGNGLCDNCKSACDLEDGEPEEDDPLY